MGIQRYKCSSCGKRFQDHYVYKAHLPQTNAQISVLLKEGCGIRSIARILGISPTTVQSRILSIASTLLKPVIPLGKEYELDELCTYIGKKSRHIWVAYALRTDTKEVVDFAVGRRTNKTLKRVTNTLLGAEAVKINTDKLRNYRSLVPRHIHKLKQYGTNHIERMNLTLRTHLKRLNRRTICFSKSMAMLSACLTIYFWG